MYRGPKAPPSFFSFNFIFGSMLSLYITLFLISRIHILHEAYVAGHQLREDEAWLLQQCDLHEFYHNMKAHSSLCDEVKQKHNSIVFLDALQHVVNNTYLCGYQSCSSLLSTLMDWILGRGALILVYIALIFIVILTVFVPVWRRFINSQADHRMHQLYHKPFGDQHYIQNHGPPHIYKALNDI